MSMWGKRKIFRTHGSPLWLLKHSLMLLPLFWSGSPLLEKKPAGVAQWCDEMFFFKGQNFLSTDHFRATTGKKSPWELGKFPFPNWLQRRKIFLLHLYCFNQFHIFFHYRSECAASVIWTFTMPEQPRLLESFCGPSLLLLSLFGSR